MTRAGRLVRSVALAFAFMTVASSAAAMEWESVGVLSAPKSSLSSVVLGDRWFVAGSGHVGDDQPEAVVDELSFSANMARTSFTGLRPRNGIEVVVNPDNGHVYLVGGDFNGSVPETDIWDGSRWTTILLNEPRSAHAVAFAAGAVVASGGWGGSGSRQASVEVLRDDAEGWRPASPMPGGPRIYHAMTTLADGHRILVTGGCPTAEWSIHNTQVEIYDAATDTWEAAAPMHIGRCGHRAARLPDGRVMVTGDDWKIDPEQGFLKLVGSSEIFDPATGTWTVTAPMRHPRSRPAMVVLPDGRVVVSGGSLDVEFGVGRATDSVELYDPKTDVWTDLPPMKEARAWHTAAAYGDAVYVAGGASASALALASIEKLTIDPPAPGADTDDAGTDSARSGCDCSILRAPVRGASTLGAGSALVAGLLVVRRSRRPRATSFRRR